MYEDTIVALATPPGRGALALIRLSGPDSIRALRALSPGARDFVPEPGRQHLLKLRDPTTGALIDEALVVCNFGPRSFTGEDTVEISTHGGVVTPRLLLAALEALGIRGALPGEFTRRAILNGKIDLLQAEAIADLIDADSTRMHLAAIHQVEGALSARISSLREELLRAEAMIAYDIDFPEEDEPAAPLSAVLAQVDQVLGRIDSLLATLPHGERLRGGALVVLAGYPNSGKSSLFNALLGVERAIVTDIPGTTRDAIEAGTTIEGFPFRLADTAGLRSTLDPVEKLGIEVAQNYIAAADLVLFCTEASGELEAGEREFLARLDPAHVLIAATKRDLSPAPEDAGAPAHEGSRSIPISVRTGEGLDQLRTALVQLAFRIDMPADPGEPIITRERHGRALARAASELRTFRNEFAAGLPPELAATHLRSATAALDALIGLTTEADVLDAVFQGFCVGK